MERIGDGLLRFGKLKREQIEQIVSTQDTGDARLFGELAVGLDFMTIGDLIYYLRDTQQSEHDVV